MKKLNNSYTSFLAFACLFSFAVVAKMEYKGNHSDWVALLNTANSWVFFGLFLFYSNGMTFLQIQKRFDRKLMESRLLFYLNLFLAWGVASLSFFYAPKIYQFLQQIFIAQKPPADWVFHDPFPNFALFSMSFSMAVLWGYYFYFNGRRQAIQLQRERVISGNVSAQFESLKNQLDPHFLFNSLNVLNALIDENPSQAQEFTQSLSKIYRYILDQKSKVLISVEEEIDFARTYMLLLQMRFEDSVTYDFPTEIQHAEAKVVPLSLQLLLENVIKHNKTSGLHPIHISIIETADYLIVENNLQKKKTHDERRGIGLQNIADRYALLTSRQLLIEETPEKFTVKLPILIKNISTMENISEKEELLFIKAKKKVEKIKKFYSHLTSYLAVNAFLMIVNLYTEPAFLWFLFPLFGWGIGILSHGMRVYNYKLFLGSNWEDKKLQQILEEEKRRSTKWE
ncbi:2TM domain-containing protein [Flavobacterium sp. JP2137]|uniref:2TM domain-containing protein n=1 Tax=Flavobacterium sp. JP2137 TaxID=3414510 RepID=UPI003D2FC5D6